jgi:hypothetical protein
MDSRKYFVNTTSNIEIIKEIDLYNNNNNSNENKSPIDCETLKLFTIYGVLMFGCSLFFNSLVVYSFIRNKKLRSPINMLILTITICNIIATISEIAMVVPSTYFCRYFQKYYNVY